MRRLAAFAIALGLVLVALGTLAQIILVLVLGGAGLLALVSALFTLGMGVFLLALTALHPAVSVAEDGLWLQPLLGGAVFVPWSGLLKTEPHPLVFNNEGPGRLLHGKGYRPRLGMLVVVRPGAGLPWRFRLVDLVTGGPARPVFAISSTTHTAYDRLAALIAAKIHA